MAKYHFTLPLLTIVLTAATPGFEDTSLLDRQVAGHLGAAIGDVGGALAPIDPKLKLKRNAPQCGADQLSADRLAHFCPRSTWRQGWQCPQQRGRHGAGASGPAQSAGYNGHPPCELQRQLQCDRPRERRPRGLYSRPDGPKIKGTDCPRVRRRRS